MSNTSKRAVYYDKAEELYVIYGLTIEMITQLFMNKVTDRTIRNWRADFDWDGKRKDHLDSNRTTLEDAKALVKETLSIARAKPTQDNIKAYKLAVDSLSALKRINVIPDPQNEEKELTPETYSEIKKELGLE